MATLSVVNYNNNKSPHKINVLQQNTSNNNNNRREIILVRKEQQILPQPKDYIKNEVLSNEAKKKRIGKEQQQQQVIRTKPQPMAVERRNARERNRVKQVNNGFANLRQHIPNSIAAAFETNTGRGNNKKLSKVETLRMAVEYIRTLEDMLSIDDNNSEQVSSLSLSSSSYPSSTPSSPALSSNKSMSFNYPIMSPSIEDDELSTNPTPPPQHYIRIDNTTNTYQIINTSSYGNAVVNGINPLEVDESLLTDPSLIGTDLEGFSGVQDLSLLHGMHGSDSLSPGMYSEQSLSPECIDNERNCFIPVFNTPRNNSGKDIKIRLSPIIVKTENNVCVNSDLPVLSLKTENEIPDEQKNNIIDVIQWWEQQEPPTTSS